MHVVLLGVSGVAVFIPLGTARGNWGIRILPVAVPVYLVGISPAALLASLRKWRISALGAATRLSPEVFLAEGKSTVESLVVFRVEVVADDGHEDFIELVESNRLLLGDSFFNARQNTLGEVFLFAAFLVLFLVLLSSLHETLHHVLIQHVDVGELGVRLSVPSVNHKLIVLFIDDLVCVIFVGIAPISVLPFLGISHQSKARK